MKRNLSLGPSAKYKKIKLRNNEEASESVKTNLKADGSESNQIEVADNDHGRFHLQSSQSESRLLQPNALPEIEELPRINFLAADYPSHTIPKQAFGPNGDSELEEKLFCIQDSSFNLKLKDQNFTKQNNEAKKQVESPNLGLPSCK